MKEIFEKEYISPQSPVIVAVEDGIICQSLEEGGTTSLIIGEEEEW